MSNLLGQYPKWRPCDLDRRRSKWGELFDNGWGRTRARWRNCDGDASFGSINIGDDFGLWAADDDVIEYEVCITYEYNSGLGNVNNLSDAEAHYTGNDLLNWRFALEDSHID